MIGCPKMGSSRFAFAIEVRTGLIDHRDLQTLGIGLFRASHSHVHAIQLAIAIRIKLSFDPQIVPDPLVGIFKTFDFLSQPSLKIGKALVGWSEEGAGELLSAGVAGLSWASANGLSIIAKARENRRRNITHSHDGQGS